MAESTNRPVYCHIGEVRPGAGVAWVTVTWVDDQELPEISFSATQDKRDAILSNRVSIAVAALMKIGCYNLVIKRASE